VKARLTTIVAALVSIFPLLLICVVSMAHTPGARAKQATDAVAAGPAQASVVGGKQATPGQFPWMAFVVDFIDEGAIACSGTVVAPRVILTAAHCVVDEQSGALRDATGYRVVTGVVNWTEPARQVSEVTRLIPYPKFASQTARDGYGDVALLVLATPTTAPKIRVESRSSSPFLRIGTHAVVAGWGQTNFEQEGFTESLMWAKTVVESSRCEGLWGRICAIDFPKAKAGICHGDSGGPIVATGRKQHGWIEIGITEAVFDKCTTRRPQLFTRTDPISKWINSRIQMIEAQP